MMTDGEMFCDFDSRPAHVLIGFGANLGNAHVTFERALQMLCSDLMDVRTSAMYRTEPHFDKPGAVACPEPEYFNAVISARTFHDPRGLLARLLEVEAALGRGRSVPCAPRTVDLDLLLYDDCVMTSDELTLPHPRMHLRNFVLAPAAQIVPQMRHPVLEKTVAELWETCGDRGWICLA